MFAASSLPIKLYSKMLVLLPGFLSGWYFKDSFLKALLTSASLASLDIPNNS